MSAMSRNARLTASLGVLLILSGEALAQRRRAPAEPTSQTQMVPELPPGVSLPGGTPPPKQPETGPGGAEYPIATADVRKQAFGVGGTQVFVFSPTRGFEGKRPLIVFGHALNAFDPKIYGAWIDHLVRRGAIVVFPRYQLDQRAQRGEKGEVIPNAAAGLRLAMTKIGDAIDPAQVAFVGHGGGGNILANLAAMPDMPKPKLLMAIMPGNSWGNRYQSVPLTQLGALPADLMVITVIGESDTVARDTDARKIIRDTPQIPPPRKMIFRMPTDSHGQPRLFASHYAPMGALDAYDMEKIPVDAGPPPAPVLDARGRPRPVAAAKPPVPVRIPTPEDFGGAAVDALDYFAFWKALDIALPVAFAGDDTTPIKRHPSLTTMGQWSDGWPVKRLSFESAREPKPAQAEAAPETTATPQPRRPRR